MKILNKEIFIHHSDNDRIDKQTPAIEQVIAIAERLFTAVQKLVKFVLTLLITLSFKYLVFSSAFFNAIQATISRSSIHKNESISKTHQFYH